MAEMTTSEAATRLGVSQREVERLVREGHLPGTHRIGRNYVIAAEPVQRLAMQSRRRGRPWTERMAWAALALLSGSEARWLTPAEKTRLTHRLRRATAAELPHLARHRATTSRYRGRLSSLETLAGQLVLTGTSFDTSRLGAWGLTPAEQAVDGYILREHLDDVVGEFGLVADAAGNVTLRAISVDDAFAGAFTPLAAVALDLTESLNTRERAAGARNLTAMLARV